MATDLILFDKKGKEDHGFSSFLKVKIKEISNKNQLKKLDKKNLLILESKNLKREILENKKTDILMSPEKHSKKDFLHNRNSGLNHILCKIAKKNNVAIGINLAEIFDLNSIERANRIGRIMQNIRLCRKYNVKMVAGSFAKNKDSLRNLKDLVSFLESIGMTPKQAKDCFVNVESILKGKKDFIIEGIKLVNKKG